jgi:hypothetical protein
VGPAGEKDVFRLDVPVYDPMCVSPPQGISDLSSDGSGLRDAQLSFGLQTGAERPALDVGRGVPERAVRVAGIENGEDVGVLQAGGDPDLLEKPLRADEPGELVPDNFEGDRTSVPEVLHQVDHGHAATAQLALEPIPLGQGRSQSRQRIRQWAHRRKGDSQR